MRILVRSPNWIGDQILTYPFFHFLRRAYPKAHIAVVCVPWVQSIQFRNLIDEVYVLPRAYQDSFFAKWDALEKGARMMKDLGPWDLGISLPNSFSSAWLLSRAQVKFRRGYSVDGRGFLLNQRVAWDQKEVCHRAEAYCRLLPDEAQVQLPATEFWGVLPENELDSETPGVVKEFNAERAWPDAEPFDPPTDPYWVLAPGSTAESRRWSLLQFAQLARKVTDETGWTGLIVGGSGEVSLAAELMEFHGVKFEDWTGRGSVSSLWKVFRQARFSVCNDSGLAHVASLCGSPVQIIWGGGDPRRTKPLGPGKIQLALNPVSCWPCEQNQCTQPPANKVECLKGIDPDTVWNEIKGGIRPIKP